VLEAAAKERAETTLQATLVDTVPMDRSEVLSIAASVPAPEPEPEPEPPSPPTPPAPSAPADDQRTTELAVDTGRLPDWASMDEEEDLLRTTVQMSAFNEELELRDED
jgi:hypothetical protein